MWLANVWRGLNVEELERDYLRALVFSRVAESRLTYFTVDDYKVFLRYDDEEKFVIGYDIVVYFRTMHFERADINELIEIAAAFGFKVVDWFAFRDEDRGGDVIIVEITLRR